MKKFWEIIKELWCKILPFFVLFGIPTTICVVIGLIFIWNDIPKLLSGISNFGNGSLLYGLILFAFSFIGAINAFAAFMLWFKAFIEWLNRKSKSRFWFWCIIIIVTFGWHALFELIKLL